MKRTEKIWYILCGAFLLGMLWRLRGTHGWGAAWGLLAAGFVFLLFLTAIVQRAKRDCFPLLCLASFSFMLTTPAWGTLLDSITGVLTLRSTASDETVDVFVHPASAVIMMLFLGFGLASVFGVLAGNYFSGKKWRVQDYLVLIAVFVAVGLIAKLPPFAHTVFRLMQPKAVEAFSSALASQNADGTAESVTHFYMTHFGNISAAKKIIGGRHYFAAVETIAFAFQAVAVLLTTRFYVKDRFAARMGAVVCGSFALAITVSDLFFYVSDGGYHLRQGLTLPDWIAAWSAWEYCTGFIAGGLITAFVLHFAPQEESPEASHDPIADKLRLPDRTKLQTVFAFLLCCIGAIGLNSVRPLMLRLDGTLFRIPGTVLGALVALAVVILLCRKYGARLEKANLSLVSPILCLGFVLWFGILYFFFGEAQIHALRYLHTVLSILSIGVILLWFVMLRRKNADA